MRISIRSARSDRSRMILKADRPITSTGFKLAPTPLSSFSGTPGIVASITNLRGEQFEIWLTHADIKEINRAVLRHAELFGGEPVETE